MASGSKFCKLGPAITPTKPNNISEPKPKAAAQGLKPPKANEDSKIINLKKRFFTRGKHTKIQEQYNYIETFLCNSITFYIEELVFK